MTEDKNTRQLSCENFKRVLIARFSALGDVAMTIPVVYSVCRAYPDTRFCLLTRVVASSLFIEAPANLEIRTIDHRECNGIIGFYKLYREISETFNPDTFIDLQGGVNVKFFSSLWRLKGVKVSRIDKALDGKRKLTRANNKHLFPLNSARARYREAFYRIGFDFKYEFRSIFKSPADASSFAEITSPRLPGEKWIAIAPFAKYEEKIYPVEKMEKVVEILSHRTGYKIFLFGAGEYEQSILDKWDMKYETVISVAKKRYGFPRELALLSYCDAMVSMDSMNMQLASLVALPVVSIWGATHPYCGFLGFGQKEENAVQLNLTCRPCSVVGDKRCRTKDIFCLSGIPVDMVISALDKVLNVHNNEQ